MRRSRASVRIMATVLALLVQALLLALFLFNGHSASPPPDAPQLVSIWLQPLQRGTVPVEAGAQTRAVQKPVASTRSTTSGAKPQPAPSAEPATAPAPATEQAHGDTAPSSRIDWYAAAAAAAAASGGSEASPAEKSFSPPPRTIRQACKPRKSSFEWNPEKKIVGITPGPLPLPYVMIGPCMVVLTVFNCEFGAAEVNSHLLDDMKDRDFAKSSVPDATLCDEDLPAARE